MKLKPTIGDNIQGIFAGAVGAAPVYYGFHSLSQNLGAGTTLSVAFGLAAGLVSGEWFFRRLRYGAAYLRARETEEKQGKIPKLT